MTKAGSLATQRHNEINRGGNSIERAFAAANGIDEVTMGEQTPMLAQSRERAASPSKQEVKRTVLVTRKKAQLTEKLIKITEEIEATEQEAAKDFFCEQAGVRTPMPAQSRERAEGPSKQKAERTALATRKKAQLTAKLIRITEEIEATGEAIASIEIQAYMSTSE